MQVELPYRVRGRSFFRFAKRSKSLPLCLRKLRGPGRPNPKAEGHARCLRARLLVPHVHVQPYRPGRQPLHHGGREACSMRSACRNRRRIIQWHIASPYARQHWHQHWSCPDMLRPRHQRVQPPVPMRASLSRRARLFRTSMRADLPRRTNQENPARIWVHQQQPGHPGLKGGPAPNPAVQ